MIPSSRVVRVAAVDPGVQECGIARCISGVVDRIALPRAASTQKPSTLAPFDLAAVLSTARAAAATLREWGPFDLVVIEWPQVYPDSSTRPEDPNDLPPLSFMHGLVLAELRAMLSGVRCLPVLPRLWTAGKQKKPRQAGWLTKQPPHVLALVDAIKPAHLRHNAIDAAHLSQWGSAYVSARSPAVVDALTVRL